MNIKYCGPNVRWLAGILLLFAGCASVPTPAFTTKRSCTNLIMDGGFEDPVNFPPNDEITFDKGQTFGNGGVWTAHTPKDYEFSAVALFENAYSVSNNLFYPTPDGANFVDIGINTNGQNPDGENGATVNCHLSQTVALSAGQHYKLSFLQSAFAVATLSKTPGNVLVKVYLSDPKAPIYHEHFKVSPASAWVSQAGEVIVPADGGGQYTLEFSSDNANAVSVIDAAWLCEKEAEAVTP
jgi:hypothetical protein